MSAILKLTYCDKKKKVEISPHLSTQIVQGMLWWVIIKAEVIIYFYLQWKFILWNREVHYPNA